jgi:syntaxin-binding protein 1
MEAMYLLMPTTQNVDRIIRDFSGQQMYTGAHLFFTDRACGALRWHTGTLTVKIVDLSEKLFSRLTSSPAEPFLRSLVDLYINFWGAGGAALKEQCRLLIDDHSHRSASVVPLRAISILQHVLSIPNADHSTFCPRQTRGGLAVRSSICELLMSAFPLYVISNTSSHQILNVCVQLNEYPSVRYYLPSHHPAVGPLSGPDRNSQPVHQQESSGRWRAALGVTNKADYSGEDHLPRVLAYMVQQELDGYKKANPNWPDAQQGAMGGPRPQALMLITDRTMDIPAAMVHEFTYQAMANDLLEISNGVKFQCVFSTHFERPIPEAWCAGTNSSLPVVYTKT